MSISFEPKYDFSAAVALGAIKGVSAFEFSGLDEDVQSSDDFADLTNLSRIILPLNAGEGMQIFSSNVNDSDTIRIYALGPEASYLDPFDIVLNGTTAVPLPGLISRINGAESVGVDGFSGSLQIVKAGTVGGAIYGELSPDHQRLMHGHYTIAKEKEWILGDVVGNYLEGVISSSDAATVKLSTKNIDQSKYKTLLQFPVSSSSNVSVRLKSYQKMIESPTDIRLQVLYKSTSVSNVNVKVSAYVDGLMIDKK